MPPLRSLLPAAAVALGLAGALAAATAPAAAQIREGLYAVQGQNPDGSGYEGQFALQPGPGATWLAAWQVAGARIVGLGVIQGGVLAVSFVVDGRPGVAAFEVEPNGQLRGIWSTGGGLGTEMLTPR
jgi:hypothetical protein